jgi:hypothetical protein
MFSSARMEHARFAALLALLVSCALPAVDLNQHKDAGSSMSTGAAPVSAAGSRTNWQVAISGASGSPAAPTAGSGSVREPAAGSGGQLATSNASAGGGEAQKPAACTTNTSECQAGAGGTEPARAGSGGSAERGAGGTQGEGGAMARLGVGGAGSGGRAAAGGGGSASPSVIDYGEGDGSDVVLMGDSWMTNTLQTEGTGGGIAPALLAVSGKSYRINAVQGVMLLKDDSFGKAIPTQYADARATNPKIATVIMTGGGNDFIQGSSSLQSACETGGDACTQVVAQIVMALDQLWSQMAEDGVHDVVYIQYPVYAVPEVSPLVQRLRDMPPPVCSSTRIRCHIFPTAVALSDLAADGIHPLESTNMGIATAVHELMISEGVRR